MSGPGAPEARAPGLKQHPETPAPLYPENPVTTSAPAASTIVKQAGGGAETKIIVSTETKDNVLADIRLQVRRMQSYFAKIRNNIGTPETAKMNIKDALRIIDLLTNENDISQELTDKIEGLRLKYDQL